MEFRQWLEANDPFFFARSRHVKYMVGNRRVSPEAQKIYQMMDKRLVKFIADEVVDDLIEQLKKGEDSIHTLANVLDYNVPYYRDTEAEGIYEPDRSLPRAWVAKVESFMEDQFTRNPKIVAYFKSPEFQKLKPDWQSVKDFRSNFTSEIFHLFELEIGEMVRRKAIQEFGNADFVLSIYGIRDGYGGPEEGGWWYNHKDLIHQIPIKGLKRAYRRWMQLEKMYKDKGQDSFLKDMMTGHGGARDVTGDEDWGPGYEGDDQEGMDISRGWTTSEYKGYSIKLQLAGSDTEETQGPPQYS